MSRGVVEIYFKRILKVVQTNDFILENIQKKEIKSKKQKNYKITIQ